MQASSAWHPLFFRTVSTSNTTDVPFMFSVLGLAGFFTGIKTGPDDDNYLEATPSTENVGEIKFVMILSGKSAKRTVRYVHLLITNIGHLWKKTHQRSKKAIAHRIGYFFLVHGCRGFGNAQLKTSKPKLNPRRKELVAYYDLKDHLMTFVFRYLPLGTSRCNLL